MDPIDHLDSCCRRHGVPVEFGRRLLPLARRATEVTPDLRQRILELVEASIAKEAERRAVRPPPATEEDQTMLRTVAAVLHSWSPPQWVLRWGDPREPEDHPEQGGPSS